MLWPKLERGLKARDAFTNGCISKLDYLSWPKLEKGPKARDACTIECAIIDSVFDSYRPEIKEEILGRAKGSLLAFSDGTVTSFGLESAQDRGQLMNKAGDEVYKGMM